MTATSDPGPPGELPPSAKFVRYVLCESGEKRTQKDLIDETGLPSRTVRYALDRLDDAGVLGEEPEPGDARQRRYWIRPEE